MLPWQTRRAGKRAETRRAAWRVIDGGGSAETRSAGAVAVQALPLGAVPTLPREGSFMDTQWPRAFWLVGRTLLIGSPARIVLDAMGELNIPRPGDAGDIVWSTTLFQQLAVALSQRARSQGGVTPTAEVFGRIVDGQAVPRPWLRALLWYVYSRDAGDWQNVLLPMELEVPRVGARAVGDQRATQGTAPFDPQTLAVNPWRPQVVQLPGFDVTGDPPPVEQPKRANTGKGALMVLAVVAVLTAVGKS